MKNVVLFIILAVLTIAALVAWNASGRNKASTGPMATVSPTPKEESGSALRKFFDNLTGSNNSAKPPIATPIPTVTVGPTSIVEMTKGGIPLSSDISPTATPSPITVAQSGNQRLIIHTAEGFSPRSITIKKGESVIFVNSVSQQMWVVTDDHATHQKLPGFDMNVALGKDGIYEYRFTSTGTWGFHNERTLNQTGTIIVE